MGEHKTNQNSQLKAAGALQQNQVKELRADIAYKTDTKQVVIIYNQKVENCLYTLPQLANHIGALVGAARKLDAEFMATEIIL